MKIAAWLLKSEPDTFSIDQLAASTGQVTDWDGVRNYQARNFLQAMKKGDRAFFYHSSCAHTGIVGEMQVVQGAVPDATQFDPESPYFEKRATVAKPMWYSPRLKFVKKFKGVIGRADLAKTAVKSSQLFTNSRLSVIPLEPAHVAAIEKLIAAQAPAEAVAAKRKTRK